MRTLGRVLTLASIGALTMAGCGEQSSSDSAGSTDTSPVETEADGVVGEPLTLIAIGDSTTDRSGGAATYRCYLDQMLTEAGVSFDFVGSRNPTRVESYGCPTEFDMDHEAASGADIASRAGPALASVETLQPDVALVMIGSANLDRGEPVDEVADELAAFVADLQAASPDLTILVAQELPCVPNEYRRGRCEEIGPAFNETIATFGELSTATSTVTVVDMHTDFSLNDFLPDGMHTTDAGDEEMARRWMAALAESGAVAP